MKIISIILSIFISAAGITPSLAQLSASQTWAATSGGSANAQTLTVPNVSSLSQIIGVPLRFVAGFTNTAATTFTVNSLSPLPVRSPTPYGAMALQGGEIQAGNPEEGWTDGTYFYVTIFNGLLPGTPVPLLAPRTYYVNAGTGSDSNTCLSAITACLTIQHALALTSALNLNGYNVTINVADGTYTSTTAIVLPSINGSGTVTINGDSGNPAMVVINNSTTGSAINAGGTIGYTIENVKLQSTTNSAGDPGAGVWTQGAIITLNNVYYGACQGGYVFAVGGTVSLFGNVVISGGVAGNTISIGAGFLAGSGGTINVPPSKIALTISTAITVVYFVYATQSGSLDILYSSITGPSNVTGTRYLATLNGTIFTNAGGASYYPGTISGATSAGGQYN